MTRVIGSDARQPLSNPTRFALGLALIFGWYAAARTIRICGC